MTGRRHETWLGLGALACTVSCGMAPAAAETMDELYAKAKPEKAVVFYSGGRSRLMRPLPGNSSSASPI